MPATVRLGTCSFADEGLLKAWYPRGVSTSRARLRYYAERFDTVEVDSPYYHLPDPGVTRTLGAADAARVHIPRQGAQDDDGHEGEPTDDAFAEFRTVAPSRSSSPGSSAVSSSSTTRAS